MPIPQGYAYESPTFQRAMRLITNVTQAINAVVTTSFDHQYETGDIVRLYIPKGWGMTQANRLQGEINIESSTSFSIDINTTTFDAFVTPADPSPLVSSLAQVVPVGEVSSKLTSATRNILPFIG